MIIKKTGALKNLELSRVARQDNAISLPNKYMKCSFVFKIQCKLLTKCTFTAHKSKWKKCYILRKKKKNDAVVIVMEKKLEKTSFAIQRKRESSSKAKKKILQLLLKVKKEAVGEL